MKKQTAVEWLYRWFNDNPEATIKEGIEAFEQALAMEKEQIEKSWEECDKYEPWVNGTKTGEQYYNETYGK